MTKKIIKYFLFFLMILVIGVFYLSFFGIKTDRFNELIKNQILDKNKNIKVNLQDIKILLNLENFSFNLQTINPIIIYDKNKVRLNQITTNFAFKNLFYKNFTIDNLEISIKETKIKDTIRIYRSFNNIPEIFILKQVVKDGYLLADINLNFDENGKIKKDYQIKGYIKNAKLSLLNKKKINDLNFNFQINHKNYLLNNLDLKFNKLKFISKLIKIKNTEKNFLIQGDFRNNTSEINSEYLSLFFKKNFPNLSNINIDSENNFQFRIDRNFRIKDFDIKSEIKLNKINYKLNLPKLKKYLPELTDLVKFENHKINLIFKKEKLSINGKGNFLFKDKKEIIEYKLENYNNNLLFDILIKLNNNPVIIDFLNYKKKDKIKSHLKLKGKFGNDKKIQIQEAEFIENKNQIILHGLNLNEYFKINSVDKIRLNIKNDDKIDSHISLVKNNNDYKILGESFDASKIIDLVLKNKNNKESGFIFNNLDNTITININKTYLDNISFINNLTGQIVYKKNKIEKLDLKSTFPNKKKITLSINKNENNEKITTLFSGYPKPLVNRYKFIKGFEEGVLDFQSIKKDKVSNSILKIDNFKVKEVPALAKLLSLASLQGIADLLTGEGIRFTDFEMIFSNSQDLMTIDELYAIGPAISIMIDGYISGDELVSLRGTLVPARTINRTISSIPIIGDLLVGKKVGEGVFGVSFKVKGQPKDLKTTVNPIKTLTPRFITRTLEKIKKN